MQDPFRNQTSGLSAPATYAEEIAPSDTETLYQTTRAIYVGGSGDVTVRLLSGNTVTLRNLQPGMYYPLRVGQVLESGTTATDLVGLS